MPLLTLFCFSLALLQADGDGQIDLAEFSTRAKNLGSGEATVEDVFHFFDDRGASHRKHRSDNLLSIDEWISGVREMVVSRGMSDEQFETEMNTIIGTCKSMDGGAVPAAVALTRPRGSSRMAQC